MTDVFFGGSYELIIRLLKKPHFAIFGEEAKKDNLPISVIAKGDS